jgi:hypothetical protein
MLWRIAMLLIVSLKLTYAMQCDCASGPEDKRGAEIVFRGKVTAFHEFEKGGRTVVFRVSRVFNGDPTETFEMPAIEGGLACFGFYPGLLRMGNELLVYASSFGSPGRADLSVRCGTKLWSDAKNISKLGRGKKPRSK